MPAALILLYGLPASGKSSWARRAAAAELSSDATARDTVASVDVVERDDDLVHVSSGHEPADAVRVAIRASYDAFVARVVALVRAAAAADLRPGAPWRVVLAVDVASHKSARRRIRACAGAVNGVAHAQNVAFASIFFDCPLELAILRNRERLQRIGAGMDSSSSASRHHLTVSDETVRRYASQFSPGCCRGQPAAAHITLEVAPDVEPASPLAVIHQIVGLARSAQAAAPSAVCGGWFPRASARTASPVSETDSGSDGAHPDIAPPHRDFSTPTPTSSAEMDLALRRITTTALSAAARPHVSACARRLAQLRVAEAAPIKALFAEGPPSPRRVVDFLEGAFRSRTATVDAAGGSDSPHASQR